MFRIAFKLLNLTGDFINVGKQTAGGFTVETGGGNERVMTLFALWPRARIEFGPIVPAFLWWEGCEMVAARAGVESLATGFGLFAGGRYALLLRLIHCSRYGFGSYCGTFIHTVASAP